MLHPASLPPPTSSGGWHRVEQVLSLVPLRALRVVASVAAHGGVAQASRSLHQCPSSVTRAVQLAEAQLGLALFQRGARGMIATPAAALLVPRVQRALSALHAAALGLRARGATAAVSALPRLVSDAMLAALVARAESPSEAAAAARLGLSQPAVHQALRRLEHVARMRLFERTRLGTRLNEAGEWMLQQTQVALHELRVGHEELDRSCGRGAIHVTIGSMPMACDVLVPQATALSLAGRDDLRITVKDGTYESLMQLLRRADVDFTVGPMRGVDVAVDLVEETLFVDRLVPVVRSGHPALGGGRRATLNGLASWPWIGALPGTPACAAFERAFARAGLELPRVAMRAHSPSVVRSVLLTSEHVALLSPLQVQAEVQAGLLVAACAPLADCERSIGITQRRDAMASAACAAVLDTLRRVAADARADAPR